MLSDFPPSGDEGDRLTVFDGVEDERTLSQQVAVLLRLSRAGDVEGMKLLLEDLDREQLTGLVQGFAEAFIEFMIGGYRGDEAAVDEQLDRIYRRMFKLGSEA